MKKRKNCWSGYKAFFNDPESFKTDERNEPRFFANSAIIGKKILVFEKGVFTSCKKRKEGKCPPWTIKANKLSIIVQKKLFIMKCCNEKFMIFQYFIFLGFFILTQV